MICFRATQILQKKLCVAFDCFVVHLLQIKTDALLLARIIGL